MAQKTITQLTDDLESHGGREGVEASQTIQFAWNGKSLEIDLNDANASHFQSVMQQFAEAARPASGGRRRNSSASSPTSSRGAASNDRESNKKVRAFWAAEYAANPETPLGQPTERGRIPKEVVAAFNERGDQPQSAPSGATQPSPTDAEAPVSDQGNEESFVPEGVRQVEGRWVDDEGFELSDSDMNRYNLTNA